MSSFFSLTLKDLAAEAECELNMRKGVYPRQIERGAMKREDAERRIGDMQAIVQALKFLAEKDPNDILHPGEVEDAANAER